MPTDAPGQKKTRPITVNALYCHCGRCGHEWIVAADTIGQAPDRPARCARCKAPRWWEPTGSGPSPPFWIRHAAAEIAGDPTCHTDAGRIEMVIDGHWRSDRDLEVQRLRTVIMAIEPYVAQGGDCCRACGRSLRVLGHADACPVAALELEAAASREVTEQGDA